MPDEEPHGKTEPAVDVAMCIDPDALARFRPVVRHLCVGLIDLNAKVRLITSESDLYSLTSMGPVETFGFRDLVWPARRRRLQEVVNFLTPRSPSLIYAVSSGVFPLGVALAEAFDVDLVVQLTSIRDIDALEQVATTRIAHYLVASDPLLRALRERLPVSDSASIVRPGVLRGPERVCFQNKDKTPSLVCTVALDDRYDLNLIIAAAEILKNEGHELMMFLLGEGPAEAALRKTVRTRNLSSVVTFAKPIAATIDILRGADIIISPHGDEDVSARPLQAMANGTAVVGFPGGVADYMHHDTTALICTEHTPTALADALRSLLTDHQRAQRIANEAREYVKKNHAMSAMADHTMRVFRSILLTRRTFPMRD